MQSLLQDIRFGLRTLLKSPGFTLVAVITLSLGIAGSSAIFSVIDGILLHPLPYPDSEKIVTLAQINRQTGASGDDCSPRRRRPRAFP